MIKTSNEVKKYSNVHKVNKEVILRFFIYFLFIPFLSYVVGFKNKDIWIDFPTYQTYFDFAKYNKVSEIFGLGGDPLFILSMKIFSGIDDGFNIFIFTCAFITLTLKITALRNSTNNFFILIALYCSYLLCLHDYIQIRISLSLALVAFGIYCCSSRRMMYCFFALAFFMHLSSIFIILSYLFYQWFGYRKFILSIFLSFFLPSLIFSGLINNSRLNTYIELAANKDQYFQINIFSSQPILQIIGLLFIFCSTSLKTNVRSYEYGIALLGVFLFYVLSAVPVLSFRFFELSMFFYIILLSRLFTKSLVLKLICFLYIVVGLKNMFYGDAALLTQLI
ncbi:EpsG family protein [Serratia fonticola]